MNQLTPEEKDVIIDKGTERPFSGKYNEHFEEGIYVCRQCGAALYESSSKFKSTCGWPSFDDEVKGAIKRIPDPDGMRTEIQCSKCGGHLGHVFEGEHLTDKNIRHCVNSISMEFIPKDKLGSIVLGGGCFWCTEATLSMLPGMLFVMPGYAGGTTPDPTYKQVCSGETGHAEVVKLVYDKKKLTLGKILEAFFKVHDPTTPNRQGNDVGSQYRSIILYSDDEQRDFSENFIRELQDQFDKPIVTEVKKLGRFYDAEDYHKDYYKNNPNQPYCMLVIRPKIDKMSHLSGGQ